MAHMQPTPACVRRHQVDADETQARSNIHALSRREDKQLTCGILVRRTLRRCFTLISLGRRTTPSFKKCNLHLRSVLWQDETRHPAAAAAVAINSAAVGRARRRHTNARRRVGKPQVTASHETHTRRRSATRSSVDLVAVEGDQLKLQIKGLFACRDLLL